MSKKQRDVRDIPQTEAELVLRIESLWSDVNYLVAKLVEAGVLPEHPGKLDWTEVEVCGTADYARRVYENARVAWEGSRGLLGRFEFQPCQHCLYFVGFTFEGWHTCGNCGKLLYIDFNGSKWHTSKPEWALKQSGIPQPPADPPQAPNAGKSGWIRP